MDTTSQPQPPPLPSDSYQPVLAEETSDTPTGEPKQHESAIYAEIASLINHSDIQTILATQAEIQQRFKESNDSLTSFNEFSSTMYNNLSGEYEKHTKALKEMKKDLDHVFKRIRQLQTMLKQKYPEAFMGNV